MAAFRILFPVFARDQHVGQTGTPISFHFKVTYMVVQMVFSRVPLFRPAVPNGHLNDRTDEVSPCIPVSTQYKVIIYMVGRMRVSLQFDFDTLLFLDYL